jgi:hypothetical protein
MNQEEDPRELRFILIKACITPVINLDKLYGAARLSRA